MGSHHLPAFSGDIRFPNILPHYSRLRNLFPDYLKSGGKLHVLFARKCCNNCFYMYKCKVSYINVDCSSDIDRPPASWSIYYDENQWIILEWPYNFQFNNLILMTLF